MFGNENGWIRGAFVQKRPRIFGELLFVRDRIALSNNHIVNAQINNVHVVADDKAIVGSFAEENIGFRYLLHFVVQKQAVNIGAKRGANCRSGFVGMEFVVHDDQCGIYERLAKHIVEI